LGEIVVFKFEKEGKEPLVVEHEINELGKFQSDIPDLWYSTPFTVTVSSGPEDNLVPESDVSVRIKLADRVWDKVTDENGQFIMTIVK